MALTVTHPTVTGAAADPTALVDGPAWDAAHTVSGNLPVSQLNSGTNASSTTFWRGDGTWDTAGGNPGGSTTEVQYNSAGTFAGISGATTDGTTLTLVAPVLGAATGTSYNKVTITAPATAATLTLIDGTTLTGPASSGTVMTLGNTEAVTGVKTFGSAGAVGRLKIAGTTSGTTVLDATAVASGTLTLPAATDTLVGLATTDELTNKTLNASVAKGTWTASGTWTIPAVTLGGTVSGGGNQINNVIIGTSTPLAGTFTTVTGTSGVITNNQNGATRVTTTNTDTGTGAEASYVASNGTNQIQFGIRGLNETNYGIMVSGEPYNYSNTDYSLMVDNAGKRLKIGGGTVRMSVYGQGGVVVGSGTTDPGVGNIWVEGHIRTKAPVSSATNYTMLVTDSSLIFTNSGGSSTLTLLAASSHTGRDLWLKTTEAQTVVSASSNVVPKIGGAAGTAILPGTDGAWAYLKSDGTNWIIMASGT